MTTTDPVHVEETDLLHDLSCAQLDHVSLGLLNNFECRLEIRGASVWLCRDESAVLLENHRTVRDVWKLAAIFDTAAQLTAAGVDLGSLEPEKKIKYPRAYAIEVARELCTVLEPFVDRLIVAGSLRRRKSHVGDVEILYIPKFEVRSFDLFDSRPVNLVDEKLEALLGAGTLEKRLSRIGSPSWGPKNKLAVHCASGVPVDLFAASPENWWNYLVCRTGPAASNTRIATLAQAKGWKWEPYDAGFSHARGLGHERYCVTSERDVFEFVGLPYLEPWER
jgi:DNA polymerase/3'-5' exonuclease PolX